MSPRVLVADDDPDMLDLVEAALTRAGADVVCVSTGADLLERLADDGPFDLVITDVAMPWMTGFQAAYSLREAGLEVPVIVMTGRDDPSIPERVRSLGEHAVLLRKPFGTRDLQRTVASMLYSPGAVTPS
jgi:two-component system OmpR family response regulator